MKTEKIKTCKEYCGKKVIEDARDTEIKELRERILYLEKERHEHQDLLFNLKRDYAKFWEGLGIHQV